MNPNMWAIYKKVGLFRWEFVKYFPNPEVSPPLFSVPDIHQQLITLSEFDNRRRYRARLIDTDSAYLETRVKTTVTPQAIIKEVIVIAT